MPRISWAVIIIGLVWAGSAMLASIRPVSAQSQPEDLIINYVAPPIPDQANQTTIVRVYFSVLDVGGKPVTGLRVEDFGVLLFGQPVTDFEIADSQDPMSVILLFDTGTSMKGVPLEKAKEAAEQFISTLDVSDEVAVYSFNSTVTNHTSGFTPDKGTVNSLINSLEVKMPETDPGTCLYDALYEAVTLAVRRPQGRGAIVALSDGADLKSGKQCSQHNVDDVIGKVQNTRMPIYTIGLPQADRTTLEKFANETGGRALMSPKAEDLPQAFTDIGHLLKDQYLLKFKTNQSGSGALQISVKGSPRVVDDLPITLPMPAPPPLFPVGTEIVVDPQVPVIDGALVFTVRFQTGESGAPIKDARWYVDNVPMGGLTDVQQAAHQLAYQMKDSAGKCLVGSHEIRLEYTDALGYKGEQTITFSIPNDMCPQPSPIPLTPGLPNVLPSLVAIAAGALATLAAVLRGRTTNGGNGEEVKESDRTEHLSTNLYAVAKIQDDEPLLVVGQQFSLLAGVLNKIPDGFLGDKITVDETQARFEISVSIHAQDMDILSRWVQSLQVNRAQVSELLKYQLIPRACGPKKICVDFYYERHWLTELEFTVEVVEASAVNTTKP